MRSYMLIGGAIVVVLIGITLGMAVSKTDVAVNDGRESGVDEIVSGEERTPAVFIGKLEAVDTGCFADAECFVVVDGKRVTAIMGWSQEIVGSVRGVEGFGDLERYIGKNVEVYAQEKEDETYTLYGNEEFYIKVLEERGDPVIGGGSTGPGEEVALPITRGACVVGGCSGQLCVDEGAADGMVTTCEYRSEYACYKTAECKRQVSGQCGWTETTDLMMCLSREAAEPLELLQ